MDSGGLQAFFGQLCPPRQSAVDFWDIWERLLPPLSKDGAEVTGYLWNTLNPQKQPEVSLSKLKNRFFGKFDPDVQRRQKQERDVENTFIRHLDTFCQVGISGTGKVDRREFDGFMRCWAFSCENERDFLMRAVECFRLNDFIGRFGIDAPESQVAAEGGGGGWRKEWGRGSGRGPSRVEEKKSTWGNFTRGKDEVARSRRGRSAFGGERYKRK